MEQWYERYPQLLDAERAAMYDFQGDKAVLGTLADGRACWCVRCQPIIAGREKRDCRVYEIYLVYDANHPQAVCGTSVKAYFTKPYIGRSSGNCKSVTECIAEGDSAFA